jgi:hypothetical protein
VNLDSYILSLSNILSRIDEYGLYCHYLGFDPDIRETYSSPIREDDDRPSFSFWNAQPGMGVEFMWKDGALDKSGTIVQLLMNLYGISYMDALRKIDTEFKLGFTSGDYISPKKKLLEFKKPKGKKATTIEISSKTKMSVRAVDFWDSYGISQETLKKYNVTEIFAAVINETLIRYWELTFAYRIVDKYKIYAPNNSVFKFINNFDMKYSEGFHQLPKKSDTLIITKSLKDVMVLHELGFESLSPRSESTVLPKEYFKWIDAHYKHVIVLFDNDMKHNGQKYPYEKKYVPVESECKDISDYVKKYSKEEAKWIIKEMLK